MSFLRKPDIRLTRDGHSGQQQYGGGSRGDLLPGLLQKPGRFPRKPVFQGLAGGERWCRGGESPDGSRATSMECERGEGQWGLFYHAVAPSVSLAGVSLLVSGLSLRVQPERFGSAGRGSREPQATPPSPRQSRLMKQNSRPLGSCRGSSTVSRGSVEGLSGMPRSRGLFCRRSLATCRGLSRPETAPASSGWLFL